MVVPSAKDMVDGKYDSVSPSRAKSGNRRSYRQSIDELVNRLDSTQVSARQRKSGRNSTANVGTAEQAQISKEFTIGEPQRESSFDL